MSDLVTSLANSVALRKRSNVDPYVIFLGAGASISSGCASMMEIMDSTLNQRAPKEYEEWQRKINEANDIDPHYGELVKKEIDTSKREKFFEIWTSIDINTRYSILRMLLWENKQLSEGYLNLAHLIKSGYFKIILTTNLDNLLERALRKVGLIDPDNFIVLINGKDKTDVIREQLDSSRIPIKIIKLHGSIESPTSYAFTPEEIFEFESILKPSLVHIINQSLIIIGNSMQDRDIDNLFEEDGKEIHFVKPSRPEIGSRIDSILKVRRQGSIIEGEDGKFDIFFRDLKQNVEREESLEGPLRFVRSIEGFLRCIGYENELKVARSRFKNLPSLYVKPTEYEDILKKLDEDHIIFIIGEPHLGKTYTAFYLLWEYYQNGYDVIHIRHDRLISLLHQNEGDMKKLLLSLFSNEHASSKVIHFDDPFGETMERRVDIFAKELDTFLKLAREYEHLRIIVTTRLNIFKEALNNSNQSSMINCLEKDLRVHTSYRRDILLDILRRYIQFYKPLWANDPNILSVINEKLPDLLPAPHNIEFFVRTSERFNSLEEVLNHVDSSKEMIKALGDWMEKLPDHEQLFLLWLEICSASEILFPDKSASHMDLEGVYNSTLGYLFVKKFISGIPPNSFYNALDKFNMIILESKDEDNIATKYNFVHPSYHEALWYAINHKERSLFRWWKVLKENIEHVMDNVENNIDLVQLRMIERYGMINRDLNTLLLISAESPDIGEQIIALEHMMEHLDDYIEHPQFVYCAKSIMISDRKTHRVQFLNLISPHFLKLPMDILIKAADLLFDPEDNIRKAATELMIYNKEISRLVRNCTALQTWYIIDNNIRKYMGLEPVDIKQLFTYISYLRVDIQKNQIIENFAKIPQNGLKLLFQIKDSMYLRGIIFMVIESYNKLNKEQKDQFLSLLSNVEISRAYNEYILNYAEQKRSIPEGILKTILSIPGEGLYNFLPIALVKSKNYSRKSKKLLNEVIYNSSDLWIGASIGKLSSARHEGDVGDWILNLIADLINTNNNKMFLGALFAEMLQNYFDKDIGMQFNLLPLLKKLSMDTEITHNAEYWMDYQLRELGYYDELYWSVIKDNLRKLHD